ncbi:MAG: hypothetical protein HKN20_08080 [Gemmatimonadetes bacterium]|nr:hypothetical protein [Gemmatimonadota bacterium]
MVNSGSPETNSRRPLAGGFLVWGVTAASAATFLAAQLVFGLARDWPVLADRAVLTLYLFVFFAVTVFGLGAAATGFAFLRRNPDRGAARIAVWLFFLVWAPAFLFFFLSNRPTWLTDPRVLLPAAILAAVLIPLSRILGRRLAAVRPGMGTIPIAIVLLAAPVVLHRSQGAWNGPAFEPPIRDMGGKRVCHLQFDGLSLRLLNKYIETGRLPHFAAYLARASRGDMNPEISILNPFIDSSSRGMRSPVIWSTINSGRLPRAHGILDFEMTQIRGLEQPLPFRLPIPNHLAPARLLGAKTLTSNSTFVREPRLWEIAESAGLRCGTVAAQVTSPPLPMEGFLVADDAAVVRKRDLWYPLDLMTPEENAAFREKAFGDEMREWFGFESPGDIDVEFREGPILERYAHAVSRIFRKDYRNSMLGLSLARRMDLDYFTLYLPGPDDVQHFFWKHTFGEGDADVDPEVAEYFGEVVPDYFRFLDYVLGEAQTIFDPDETVFVITSDHGLGPWSEHASLSKYFPFLGKGRHPFNTGNHRRDGVFLLAGPGVEPGDRKEASRDVDIAPTILYFLGLPVPEDTDGKVILDAITSGELEQRPIESIASYSPLRRSGELFLEDSAAIRERLRALGYVD